MTTTTLDPRVRKATEAMAKARKEAVERKEREELMKQYPYLIPLLPTEGGTREEIHAAYDANRRIMTKNIKAMLKHVFPDMKFSVTRNNFSGGFDYSIRYKVDENMDWDEREAKRDEVRKAVAIFEKDVTYGMDDSYITKNTPFNKVFGGMPYMANVYEQC